MILLWSTVLLLLELKTSFHYLFPEKYLLMMKKNLCGEGLINCLEKWILNNLTVQETCFYDFTDSIVFLVLNDFCFKTHV